MSLRSILPFAGAGAFLLAFCSPAAAAVIADDFNDGNDDGWTHHSPIGDYGSPASFSFPSGTYRIDVPASASPQDIGPARAASVRQDADYADFDVSVDLPALSLTPIHTDLGLLTRITDLGPGTTNGYSLTYNPSGTLSLLLISGEMDTPIQVIPFTLNPSQSYRLRFVGHGVNLFGTVTDLSNSGTPLVTVSGTDNTWASGAVALFIYDDSGGANQSATGVFDNFQATIPEPSAAALAAGGLLLLRRRRVAS